MKKNVTVKTVKVLLTLDVQNVEEFRSSSMGLLMKPKITTAPGIEHISCPLCSLYISKHQSEKEYCPHCLRKWDKCLV